MKKLIFILIVALNINTCYAALYIAHMGYHVYGEPNSFRAYLDAATSYFYGIEGDIRYDSKRCELYMSHDELATSSDACTLNQVLDIVEAFSVKLILDVKWFMPEQGLLLMCHTIKSRGLTDKVVIQDSRGADIKVVREQLPDIEVWYLVGNNRMVYRDSTSFQSTYIGAKCVNIPITIVDKEWVDELHNEGKKVCIYNVNSVKDNEEAMRLGCDYIMTDRDYTREWHVQERK